MKTPNGYEFTTTFWRDFTIADAFGIDAVQDTYNRAFNEWKHDHIKVTEMALVLNWKIWQWWDKGNMEFAKLYDKLWKEVDAYAMDNLKGNELQFYIRVTD